MHDNSKKNVYSPIPHTQHRPIGVYITPVIQAKEIPIRRRFNFKKANWTSFETTLDQLINERELEPTVENYNTFIEVIKTAPRKTIPRGCRRKFIPGLNEEHMYLYEEYQTAFTNNPFSKETSELGEKLIDSICEQKRSSWQKLIEETDMKHSSRKAWGTMKILSNNNTKACPHPNVTANQVAMQLIENGKTTTKKRNRQIPTNFPMPKETSILDQEFTIDDLANALKDLKNGKASGIDDICNEKISHFGATARKWLLGLFNYCIINTKIPKSVEEKQNNRYP